MKLRTICKSKIHHATVTGADLNYIGSIGIDASLLRRVDIVPGEQVAVWNVNNGQRVETYAIALPEGSGQVVVNGAAARHFTAGDRVIIVAFCQTDEAVTPRMIAVDERNAFAVDLGGHTQEQDATAVHGVDALRSLYPPPLERAVRKSLPALDQHMRSFIALSPFLCMGTSGAGGGDVTPRGDRPGFVHVVDDSTLLIPDWPGNSRLDSLVNLQTTPQVALLFFIPGVDETLRVNGTSVVTTAPDLLARWEVDGKRPRSALRVTVAEAFLHCAKALIRSRLWRDDYKVSRDVLPSYAAMLKDQTRLPDSVEQLEAAIQQNYSERLY